MPIQFSTKQKEFDVELIYFFQLLTFPEECRIAKLKPIFKKGARTDRKNYEPISLLLLVSKIIKQSIHFEIEDYHNQFTFKLKTTLIRKTNLSVSVRLQKKSFNRYLSDKVHRLHFSRSSENT